MIQFLEFVILINQLLIAHNHIPYHSLNITDSISSNSLEGCEIGPAASTQCKVKFVHFESQSDSCSSSSKSSSSNITKVPLKPNESPFDHTTSKPSPYPTPLKLTDDMQTPGTVFPSYGKNPRIRVQYLHSGINPRNFSQLDTPIEEACIDQSDKESPQLQVKLQENPAKKELNMCPTLSSWLAPKSNNKGLIDQSLTSQTPGDRRILGVVNSEWNADETSFTPKWGDVNGIPNTTNKYSEVNFVHSLNLTLNLSISRLMIIPRYHVYLFVGSES